MTARVFVCLVDSSVQISAVNSDVSANASGIYEESNRAQGRCYQDAESCYTGQGIGPGKHGLGVQAMGWMLQRRSLVGEGWRV